MQQNDQQPVRVVVELMSPADVKRLDDSDEKLLQRINALEARVEGLHRTVYELMDALRQLRSKRS